MREQWPSKGQEEGGGGGGGGGGGQHVVSTAAAAAAAAEMDDGYSEFKAVVAQALRGKDVTATSPGVSAISRSDLSLICEGSRSQTEHTCK